VCWRTKSAAFGDRQVRFGGRIAETRRGQQMKFGTLVDKAK
jgi:hypothetical protein